MRWLVTAPTVPSSASHGCWQRSPASEAHLCILLLTVAIPASAPRHPMEVTPMTPPKAQPEQPLPALNTVRSLQAVTVTSAPAPIFGQLTRQPPPGRKPRLTSATVRPLDFTDLDWSLVYRIRHTVSDRLSDETGQQLADGQIDEATRVQIGRDLIAHVVKKHSDEAILAGDRDNQIAAVDLERYTRAVDSSIFGYGRWQPLLEDPHVENIEILGYNRVFMVYADRIVQVAPVADSDAELIEQLQFISAYSNTPKPFSPAHPVMTLNLEDRFRLHAEAFVADRPSIVIRQHSFAGVSLEELRAWRHDADHGVRLPLRGCPGQAVDRHQRHRRRRQDDIPAGPGHGDGPAGVGRCRGDRSRAVPPQASRSASHEELHGPRPQRGGCHPGWASDRGVHRPSST